MKASFPALALALLLGACASDDRAPPPPGTSDDAGQNDGSVVPASFPAGMWAGTFTMTHGEEVGLVVGLRWVDGITPELALAFDGQSGFVARPAVEAGALVYVGARFESRSGCGDSIVGELDWLELRLDEDRLVGAARGFFQFRSGGVVHQASARATIEAAPYTRAPELFAGHDGFLTPVGRLAGLVNQPVVLPETATIEAGGATLAAVVENGGRFDASIRIRSAQPLPWGTTARVRALVRDGAGAELLLEWENSVVAAPAAERDPLLADLGGYAVASLEPLAATEAEELLGRQGGLVARDGGVWLLAFEAEVPDTADARLEVDLLRLGDEAMQLLPETVTIAAGELRHEAALVFQEVPRRAPATSSRWGVVEAPAARPVPLDAFRGRRVVITLGGLGTTSCGAPDGESASVVIERIEIVP